MHVALIAPAPFARISGGYAYDRCIVAGLRQAGHEVEVIELAGRHPLPDETAVKAAERAWNALPAGVLPVIDGLCLPAFINHADALAARRSVALIHHPTALETGHKEADRAKLQEMERHLFAAPSRLIVTSEPTAVQLAEGYGVDRARIAVVLPGTDDAPRSKGSGSKGSGGPSCIVLSVGTLVPRKGHDVLLRALALLSDLDWRLDLVGSPDRAPDYARMLRKLAADLGVSDRVRFLGEMTVGALDVLWQGADLFALATHWEGYGMAVAEALKRGLPVAVTSGGAAGALVSPETGIVAPPGDVEALSKAMRRLIFDIALRRDMAEAAWQAGRALPSWPDQAKAFAQALAS